MRPPAHHTALRGLGLALVVAGALAGSASASLPGRDGRIAFDGQLTPSGLRGLLTVAPGGGSAPRRLGGLLGAAPAWSADGRRLAFSSAQFLGSSGALFVAAADGSHPRELAASCGAGAPTTTCGGSLTYPTWAPDGRRLAFVNLIGGRDCPPSDVTGCLATPHSALEVINSDGTHRRTLFVSPGPLLGKPAWSPDGSTIVYAQPDPRDGGSCVGTGLWTIRPDGSHRRQLLGSCRPGLRTATAPDWSPDGRRIAFSAESQTVYRHCAYASPQVLVNCVELPLPPHPLGPGAGFFEDAVVDIFVVDRSGGHLRRVTHNRLWPVNCLAGLPDCAQGHHDAESPSWSPDGRSIAFAAGGVWTISPAGGHQRQLAAAAGAADVAWQPLR